MANPEKLYGLIGYPLGHSMSASFFNQKFESENIAAEYRNFPIASIDELPGLLAQHPNLAGLNVTIPYKQQVIPFLSDIDPLADQIGAVNVIKFTQTKDGLHLKGYNSDIIGFTRSIEPLIDKNKHKAALILGTGGASKAIKLGLEKLGLETQYVSRQKTAQTLAYEELTHSHFKHYKVIVNCTPLGMYPNMDTCPDIPYRFLSHEHICYDLVYNPEQTLFLIKAQEQGAVTKGGLEMLILQALAAYEIWNK